MDTADAANSQNTFEQQAPVQSVIDPDKHDIEQNKDIAAFGYLWIMSFLVYFLRRRSAFVRYHATQSMILSVLSFVVLFVPYLSKMLELCLLALMVYGFLNAAQGLRKDIPIIGPLSRGEMTIRQAWQQVVQSASTIGKALRSMKSSPPQQNPPPPPSSNS